MLRLPWLMRLWASGVLIQHFSDVHKSPMPDYIDRTSARINVRLINLDLHLGSNA